MPRQSQLFKPDPLGLILEREIARGRFPRPLKIGKNSRVSLNDLASYIRMLESERRKARGLPKWWLDGEAAQLQLAGNERAKLEREIREQYFPQRKVGPRGQLPLP